LTNQEKFRGIFREESLKFPGVRGKVGDFNTFWRFDHPVLTIQEKFQGIFREESPKFPGVRGERWVSLTRWGNLTTLF